jgi:hypothetical protein
MMAMTRCPELPDPADGGVVLTVAAKEVAPANAYSCVPRTYAARVVGCCDQVSATCPVQQQGSQCVVHCSGLTVHQQSARRRPSLESAGCGQLTAQEILN